MRSVGDGTPLFSAQIDVDGLVAYEYVIHHADGTNLHESTMFKDGQFRIFLPSEGARPNEFFGDAKTFTDLAQHRLPSVHSRNETLVPHTIYNESMVGTVHLEVDQAAWDKFIKASSKPKNYFNKNRTKPRIEAKYSFVNAEAAFHATAPVSVSLGGFGSLQQQKKSYVIHLGKADAKAWGLKKHKVKAYTYDPSLVHEQASVDIWRAMGVPVHRLAWTRLFINGKSIGIYNNLETISNSYLHGRFPAYARIKGQPDATVYKCDDKAYMTASTVDLCHLDQGAASDLAAVTRVLTAPSDEATFETDIEAIFDVPAFIKASAVELATLRRDGYYDDGSNYVMFLNPGTRKWTYVSWDFEINMFAPLDVKVFDKSWSFFKAPFIETSVFPPYMPEIPLTRILQMPKYKSAYAQYLKETADLMTSPAMEARLTALHDTLRPYVAADPLYGSDMAFTPADFDKSFDSLVAKSKIDILLRRVTGWAPGIPDIFHSDLLDVDIKGMKPFMAQRAASVYAQLEKAVPTATGLRG